VRFRTSLQKNWSLFPGNGFLRAETNAPEWPLRQTSRLKETNHAHETRLIRVIPRQLGKSRFAQDCVVGPGEVPFRLINHCVIERCDHEDVHSTVFVIFRFGRTFWQREIESVHKGNYPPLRAARSHCVDTGPIFG
jgi:hypothetical protein